MSNFTSNELAVRIFHDFSYGQGLEERRAKLEHHLLGLEGTILGDLPTVPAPSPDYFIASEPHNQETAKRSLRYFQRTAVMREVELSLQTLTTNLAEEVVGRAVVIRPVSEEGPQIKETWYSSGLRGSRQQEPSSRHPRKANGVICKVDPARNLLKIDPARGTNASMNQGYYNVPVIGEDGEPLITIEPRESTWRDRPSRTGQVLRKILPAIS